MEKNRVGWSLSSLRDELDFFNGKTVKAKSSGKYPIYGSNGRIGFSQDFIYSDSIILGRVGAYCGSVFYEKDKFWPSDNTIVVRAKNSENNKFFYYVLKNYPIRSFAGGAAQPLITQSLLKKFQMFLPEQDSERKRIVSILNNYDYSINNNTRRIEIIESIAKLIYDEWFVKFKFPGHEKVKMVDSELGDIPEGWSVQPLKQVCEKIFSGGTPDTSNETFWNGKFPWLSSGETKRVFILSTDKTITQEGVNFSSTRLAKKGDILIASAGQGKTRGQVCLACIDTYINQSIISLRAKSNNMCSSYLFYLLSGKYDALRNMSDANAIRGSLTCKMFENLKIVIPPKNILDQFDELIEPIIHESINLLSRNSRLRATRDLLLPKLISGELDVSELDIKVPEVEI